MTFTNRLLCAVCILTMLESCSGITGTPGDGGDAGDAGDAGEAAKGVPTGVFLDGRELLSNENVYLADGGHLLETRDAARLTFPGDFSGPGSLSITVPPKGTLALTGKQLHQGSVLMSGKLDLLDAGYFSGNVSVAEGDGQIQRLALPIDISSELRVWFDGSDDKSLFSDWVGNAPASSAGSEVSLWRNRAKSSWANARRSHGSPKRSPDKKSLVLNYAAFEVNDIYLKSEATIVVAMTPFAQTGEVTTVFTSSFTGDNVLLTLGNAVVGGNGAIPKLGLGAYGGGARGWSYLTEVELNDYQKVLVGGTTAADGSLLQFNGKTVRASPGVRMYGQAPSAMTGQWSYFIARRWDTADSYLMELSELVVVGDTGSLNGISGYVAWHNGLQDKLAGDHPYKQSPPVATITSKGVVVKQSCESGRTCKDYELPRCAPLCAANDACLAPGDCASWNCVSGFCTAPGCTPKCATGRRCGVGSDCVSGTCVNNFCS